MVPWVRIPLSPLNLRSLLNSVEECKNYIMSKVYDWFEERLEVQAIADDISSKYVPPHVNIFYCFGGLVLTCFLIQVATGFAMTFYYRPSVVDAFASVEYIMTSVNFGWLIRSLHRWSASINTSINTIILADQRCNERINQPKFTLVIIYSTDAKASTTLGR